jgi:hypothetical protein
VPAVVVRVRTVVVGRSRVVRGDPPLPPAGTVVFTSVACVVAVVFTSVACVVGVDSTVVRGRYVVVRSVPAVVTPVRVDDAIPTGDVVATVEDTGASSVTGVDGGAPDRSVSGAPTRATTTATATTRATARNRRRRPHWTIRERSSRVIEDLSPPAVSDPNA